MSSSSKASNSSGPKETILLRKPAPKYSFDGRKLPKEPATSSGTTGHVVASPGENSRPNPQTAALPTTKGLVSGMNPQQKPMAIVGASIQSNSGPAFDCCNGAPHVALSDTQDAPLLKSPSVPTSLAGSTTHDKSQFTRSKTFQSLELTGLSNQQMVSSSHSQSQSLQDAVGSSVTGDIPEDEREASSSMPSQSEQLQAVREERDKLRAELSAQLQVNSELKRLLVASVGDDLYERVENLCRDRAQLELDIGGFSKKMSEDYENLDKISIQADMWRSKYLASRVMTEELSSAKAYYSLQCHDSHSALQQLLSERHELRINLVESYKTLQQVKNAFDPLNTHKSSSLRSTNVLDLSQACQQLSEAVRFRLLPASVVINVSADVSNEAWQDSITRAEQLAQEVLSRPIDTSGPSSSQAASGNRSDGSMNMHKRYHPSTRYENLTITCNRCRGEIIAI